MKKHTILIVDDVEFDRKLLCKVISGNLECEVVEATSGEEALEILSTRKIDLVLLDIEMPILSGDEVILKIRKEAGLADLPIIMVSGKTQDEIIVKCLKSGANDYITKPVNFQVALTRITCHLKLSQAIKERAILQELEGLRSLVITYNHEINNPLAIISGSAENLQKISNDPEKFKNKIQVIQKACDRISEIVKEISRATTKNEVQYETYSGSSKMLKLK